MFGVVKNQKIAEGIYEIKLSGCVDNSLPGMFVNVLLDGFYLRRPISVCDVDKESLTLVYKVVGGGTDALSHVKAGEKLDLLTGLGNGFDLDKCKSSALVVGGGVGTPPMLLLTKKLLQQGKKVIAALGFNSAADVILADRFAAAGAEVRIATVDGSVGTKGFVTVVLPEEKEYDFFYACGPKPMLRALCEKVSVPGEISLEERMGCGFGACMGCAVNTVDGVKRVCADGPVFDREKILWTQK